MDTDGLVRDYLGRLDAASASLHVERRAELAAEVRDHIDSALAEAGRSDEVTVRNILERLGSPEEIVAGEVGPTVTPHAGTPAVAVAGARSNWGAVEVTALVLIGLAWPALLLPFGLYWWLGLGVVGLVLVWASGIWSARRKLITTVVVVALYALLILVTFPTSVRCFEGPARTPVECPGAPSSPIVEPAN